MKCKKQQKNKLCAKQPGDAIIPTKAKWCTGCDNIGKDKIVKKTKKEIREDLNKKLLELCYEIEKLPASEQQTKISVMMSDLMQNILKK
jgi:hypothetical protein